MKKPIAMAFAALGLAVVPAAGCADILGFEPAVIGSSGGAGGSTGSGGNGTGAGTSTQAPCKVSGDCIATGSPECVEATCTEGTCVDVPINGGLPIACYDGPAATNGVGICKPGIAICTAGKPGTCNTQTLPMAMEDCHTIDDETCDGNPGCPGKAIDARLFKATDSNEVRDVAFDPGGDFLYITGVYKQHGADLFGCPLPLFQAYGAFVAKLASSNLHCEWAVHLEGAESATELTQLIVREDRVWAVGSIEGTQPMVFDTMGAIPLTTDDVEADAVVLELDAMNGQLVEAVTIGGSAQDRGRAIAMGEGLIYVAVQGGGSGTVRKGNELPPMGTFYLAGGGAFDTIVLALHSSDATLYWPHAFGSPESDSPHAVAYAGGKVLVGGGMFGTTPAVCTLGVANASQAFLLGLDASNGTELPGICQSFGGPGATATTGIGVAAQDGGFAAAGYVFDDAAVGCGPDGSGTKTQFNAWLRLGNVDQPCVKVKVLAGPGLVTASGAHAEPFGDGALFMGTYLGTLAGITGKDQDVFFHRYDSTLGDPLSYLGLGAAGKDEAWSFAVNPAGNVAVLVGSCSGAGFAVTGLPAVGDCDGSDGFLVRIGL
jgi:hypothetical protein